MMINRNTVNNFSVVKTAMTVLAIGNYSYKNEKRKVRRLCQFFCFDLTSKFNIRIHTKLLVM